MSQVQFGGQASANALNVSGTAGLRQYLLHPDQAPPGQRALFQAMARQARSVAAAPAAADPVADARAGAASGGIRFTSDDVGLPQNEQSVDVCRSDDGAVLGGSNDYRGIVDPGGNFTGWYLSTDGGRSRAREGLLPPIRGIGEALPSGGDPVVRWGKECSAYAADLNVGAGNIGVDAQSGVGVYRSDLATLRNCPEGDVTTGGLVRPSCWPTRRLVATAAKGHFLDKEWMAVGHSGSAGEVVWVTYGDLSDFDAEGNEQSGAIKAVRCDATLQLCSAPITLSSGQKVAEYPTVNIAPDGTTVVTWGQFFGGSFLSFPQQAWVATAPPGSTTFTRHPAGARRPEIIRGREVPHAANFRFGTMFPSTVTMVAGRPRIVMVWAECQQHALGAVCEEPRILSSSSSDLGTSWTPPRIVSVDGDNFMPTLNTDDRTGQVVAAWYTTRHDPMFHHRYDVEMATLTPDGQVQARTRVTNKSTEPDADPVLTGRFIGDYFEVMPLGGRALVHFTANYKAVALVRDGVPIPQQDNFLARVAVPSAP